MNINLNPLSNGIALNESSTSKNPTKLEVAAKQFESLMIAQMMKTERDTSGGGWLSDGDQTGEDSSMGMAEEQFAQSLASNGGLGLAKMVVRTMSRAVANNAPSPVPVPSK